MSESLIYKKKTAPSKYIKTNHSPYRKITEIDILQSKVHDAFKTNQVESLVREIPINILVNDVKDTSNYISDEKGKQKDANDNTILNFDHINAPSLPYSLRTAIRNNSTDVLISDKAPLQTTYKKNEI